METKLVVNEGRSYVEQMLEAHRFFNEQDKVTWRDPTPVYEFVLANGQEWNGTTWTKFRGRGYHKMRLRQCFQNAFTMSLIRPELTYYEGFAWAGLITVHHAWCVDDQGLVVDPTWRKSAQRDLPETEWEYFGIGFDSRKLSSWWFEKYTSSVLFDLVSNGTADEFVVTA